MERSIKVIDRVYFSVKRLYPCTCYGHWSYLGYHTVTKDWEGHSGYRGHWEGDEGGYSGGCRKGHSLASNHPVLSQMALNV
jgi:hypothetical protein